MKLILTICVMFWLLIHVSRVDAGEIGFIEDFALSGDRAKVLEQLIPGTEDYYFYHCLHAQHTGNFDEVHRLMELWVKRWGYSVAAKEILNRQALIEYQKNPDRSLEHIRRELGLRFDHRRELPGAKTDDPEALDSNLISVARLTEQAFARYRNLDGVEDAGLDILSEKQLEPDRRRDLLKRLTLPDRPDLAELVVADLKYKHSGGFGSFKIHQAMTLQQLDACIRLMPELLTHSTFVHIYLTRLAPSDDTDIRYDLAEKRKYIERMWAFAEKLNPAHNSLKVHVLYHLLDMDRQEDRYDPDRFMNYVRLPRNSGYMEQDYLQHRDHRHVNADLSADYSGFTGLPPVVDDVSLVKDYLAHFFRDAPDHKKYIKYIQDAWLQALFAETKILAGIGDMEKWYSMMNPVSYQALKARVDIEFVPSNKRFFSTTEPVHLELDIKNVETLMIKVFELNTLNYYKAFSKPVDTTVDLDGLVAPWENVVHYKEPALRRVRRSFDFPQINHRGVFVVEFIGNGKSSRAVIQKGDLRYLTRLSAAGHEFMILDENNRLQPDASLWLAGQEFLPDEDGVITVPFAENPGEKAIILKSDAFCSLARFNHKSENYHLTMGCHVDRESLIKRQKAAALIRPMLTLNGSSVDMSLLKNVRMTMVSTDQDGISASREITGFEIKEGMESVVEFIVPENLAGLRFDLTAEIKNLSRNKQETLSASAQYVVNSIDSSLAPADVFLSHTEGQYHIGVLGKNGERRTDQPLKLELKHRYFKDPVHVSLKTGADGRIRLGELKDISWLKAELTDLVSRTWYPISDTCQYPNHIHADSGNKLRIPYMGNGKNPGRTDYALFEKRGGVYLSDRFDSVTYSKGYLEFSDIAPGNYELYLKQTGKRIDLRITEGADIGYFVTARHRILQKIRSSGLQVLDIKVDKAKVTLFLDNVSETTRVHVFATRFMPDFHPFDGLVLRGLPEPYEMRLGRPMSLFVSGRTIGDEYRYILERKYAIKHPGNMLNRPELLLNPWDVRKTETAVDRAMAGESYAREGAGWKDGIDTATAMAGRKKQPLESVSNLDFLAKTTAVFMNQKPDKDGTVAVSRAELKSRQQLHIIAVDKTDTVYREFSLPQTDMEFSDLRMVRRIDPKAHFSEQKQTTILIPGQTFRMEDITTSEFEVYDTLHAVYTLMATLSDNPTLKEFSFILEWPNMSDEDKNEKYSKYACHELNFFIFHRDKPFFDRVIRNYLENKKDKTFLDHWLLDNDLSAYLAPRKFEGLNVVEKILLLKGTSKDSQNAARYVKDLYDLIPPDPESYNRLFDTALKSRTMEKDRFGYDEAKDSLLDSIVAEKSAGAGWKGMDAPEPAAAPPSEALAFQPADKELELSAIKSRPKAAKPMRQERKKSETVARRHAEELIRQKLTRRQKEKTDLEKRRQMRQFYRKEDKTREWAENNYYRLPVTSQNADLIRVNAFWKDFARAESGEPFLSENFIYAVSGFSEMMLALSVLDVPFSSEKQASGFDGIAFSMTVQSPAIVFHKQIREANLAEEKLPVMVSQNFFRQNDRYRYVDNERIDRFVTDEFLYREPYGCQVVISNPTSARLRLRGLIQIPDGAMPLKNGFYSRGVPIAVEPYGVRTFEYYFYFPEVGTFDIYPFQVAKDEDFIAGADSMTFNVVEKPTRVDTDSWDYISQNGTSDQVLDFIRNENVHRIALKRIAFRMKDRDFFNQTITLLQHRFIYDSDLWSYSVHHNDPEIIAEYLPHTPYADRCGMVIASPLLTLNPIDRNVYQHLEYKPLINARAHQLGKRRKILNDRFYGQYIRFMKKLSYQPKPEPEDLAAVTVYMLLQDRVDDAAAFLGRIPSDHLHMKLQHDYIKVYMAFYQGDVEKARQIAEPYADYPVPLWQKRFRNALAQLDEIAGKPGNVVDDKDRAQQMQGLAETEPSFDFSIASRRITLNYRNLDQCRINYYPMDIELLFSRNPFLQKETDQFAMILPHSSTDMELNKAEEQIAFDLPQAYHNSNLMVEILGAGLKKSCVYYAHSLDVQVIENYGYVNVAQADTRKPLPGTYVKVFARMRDKDVRFYKDGYTDLRGRFDYMSLSTDETDRVERFALLILHPEHGAVIREVSRK